MHGDDEVSIIHILFYRLKFDLRMKSSRLRMRSSRVRMRSSRVRMRSSRVRMRSSRVRMRSSRVRMRSSRVRMRSSRVRTRSSRVRIRSSRVVRAPGCQSQSRNSPGFEPSVLRHNGIREAADEAVLNNVHQIGFISYSHLPDSN
jgi:hypothetical protein